MWSLRSSGWLGQVIKRPELKLVASQSANMTSKFIIDRIVYLRSPNFPIFFFATAASTSFVPARVKFLTSGKARHPILFILFSTGDTMLMATTTNQRDTPNVTGQPRPKLARGVRKHDS
jgi:hypothetical protein